MKYFLLLVFFCVQSVQAAEIKWCNGAIGDIEFISDYKILSESDLGFIESVDLLQKFVREQKKTVDAKEILKEEINIYTNIFIHLQLAERIRKTLELADSHIHPINDIEKKLLSYHLDRVNGCALYEFEALIFERGSEQIIFYNTSYSLGVSKTKKTWEAIQKIYDEGYELKKHIHNHPFLPDGLHQSHGGMLWPSGDAVSGDLGSYIGLREKYGLEEVIITNGFDSLRIPAKNIEILL